MIKMDPKEPNYFDIVPTELIEIIISYIKSYEDVENFLQILDQQLINWVTVTKYRFLKQFNHIIDKRGYILTKKGYVKYKSYLKGPPEKIIQDEYITFLKVDKILYDSESSYSVSGKKGIISILHRNDLVYYPHVEILKHIQEIPKEIGILKQLVKLNIYGVLDLFNQNFDKIYGYFTKIPVELFNLTDLSVNHTNITEIPKEIVKLIKLKKLDLKNNMLTRLPDELFQHKKFKKYDVHDIDWKGNPIYIQF